MTLPTVEQRIFIWLGYWRDSLPPEAVKQLQAIADAEALAASDKGEVDNLISIGASLLRSFAAGAGLSEQQIQDGSEAFTASMQEWSAALVPATSTDVMKLEGEIEAGEMLAEALQGFGDDYMTSEKHHPGYVLIPAERFDAISQALALHPLAPPESPGEGWKCAAIASANLEPQDCNWPHCGCDPKATEVLQALDEQGYTLTDRHVSTVSSLEKRPDISYRTEPLCAPKGEIEAIREALRACRDQFEFYVNSHMAKKTPDGLEKAMANRLFVELCNKALSYLPQGAEE